jgi:hypothetical protein
MEMGKEIEKEEQKTIRNVNGKEEKDAEDGCLRGDQGRITI